MYHVIHKARIDLQKSIPVSETAALHHPAWRHMSDHTTKAALLHTQVEAEGLTLFTFKKAETQCGSQARLYRGQLYRRRNSEHTFKVYSLKSKSIVYHLFPQNSEKVKELRCVMTNTKGVAYLHHLR